MPVTDAAPEKPASARQAGSAPSVPERTCAECGGPRGAGPIFCRTTCRRAWHIRQQKRGAQLLPFAIVARITRGGTRGDTAIGRRANSDTDMLIGRWRDEDLEANGGKGRMDATAYLALRYRLGLERP